MTHGKRTCRILKEIRRQIAEANDIELITSECRHKGDCPGTCPKCEAEVSYLERQLRTRQLMGKAVVLAGLSAGLITMSGCSSSRTDNSSQNPKSNETITTDSVETIEVGPVDQNSYCGEIPEEEETAESEIKELVIIPESIKTGEIVIDESASLEPEDNIYKYTDVDQKPEYPGGEENMIQFISQNLKYPEYPLLHNIQGRVVVKFYIDTIGHVCKPSIVRGKDPDLDKEAIRVVRMLPTFIPGKVDGKAVNTWMNVPIVFKLPSE